jgi:hypothetical protein
MKIIDIGKCIDNIDPLGIGRIRVSRYNDYTGQKEKAIDYEPWSDRDLFIANPFLPNNLNFIPEINQSVKIVQYNSEKDTVNVEYIAGPFTTMYDYNGQTFSQQVANTTYGATVKKKPNIRNPKGEYINKKSENAFATEKDFAIYGKNGSDVLFTENGLQLRGGKLLSKDAASPTNKATALDYPLMAKKSSRIYLKKFPKKMILEEVVVKNNVSENKDLKYIVEYDVSNLKNLSEENTGIVNLYVYKVIPTLGDEFKTNYFTENSDVNNSHIKLINTESDSITPSYSVTATSINDVYREIRDKIFLIHDKGLTELNGQFQSDDVHPFYFRPTKEFKTRSFTDPLTEQVERDNRQLILNNINVLRIGPSSGLIWSKTKAKLEIKEVESIEKQIKVDPNSPEQTFTTIISDKLFLLSTDLNENESSTPIIFDDLDKYEITQREYIEQIDPKTFSTVRGENLLRLLGKMIEVIFTHRHNPLMPIAGQYDYAEGNELKELLKTIENDILNKSIRIN